MSQSKTPKAPTQAPRDEKPPGKEEPLFAYRIGPDGELQRFHNRDPDYRWTMQSPREAQFQRRPQQSKLVQQQQPQVQSGSYTNFEPSPRKFGGSLPMPGYQGLPGSYGNVKAAVVPSDRMQTISVQQAQSGSYLASEYGLAARATDGAPWSTSSYEAIASQHATAEAEHQAMQQAMCESEQATCGREYNSHQQGASGSYSSASGSIRQRKATLQQAQQQSGCYQDFDVRDGPYVDCMTQTTHQQQSRSGSYQRPDRDSLWKDTRESAASLHETTPRPKDIHEGGYRRRARQDTGHYAPTIDPRREPEWNTPLDPDRWSSARRSRSPQGATGEGSDQDAISALEAARAGGETDVVKPSHLADEVATNRQQAR